MERERVVSYLNYLGHEVHLSNIKNFSSYLGENALRLY
jgi:hypothetical protein